jgi:hypothetical protein
MDKVHPKMQALFWQNLMKKNCRCCKTLRALSPEFYKSGNKPLRHRCRLNGNTLFYFGSVYMESPGYGTDHLPPREADPAAVKAGPQQRLRDPLVSQ